MKKRPVMQETVNTTKIYRQCLVPNKANDGATQKMRAIGLMFEYKGKRHVVFDEYELRIIEDEERYATKLGMKC